MGRATPSPKFPDGIWDGTTPTTQDVTLEVNPDVDFGARYRAEIIALEQTLDGYITMLDTIAAYGVANSILGVRSDGTALEYKTLVEGSNVTIAHAAGSITISASGGGGATPLSGEADIEIKIGMPVHLKADTHVEPAKADAAGTAPVAGIALTAAAPTVSCQYLSEGQVSQADWTDIIGVAALTPGAEYFLSASTAGQMTTSAPTTAGQYVVRLGRANSTTKFDIEIEAPILL